MQRLMPVWFIIIIQFSFSIYIQDVITKQTNSIFQLTRCRYLSRNCFTSSLAIRAKTQNCSPKAYCELAQQNRDPKIPALLETVPGFRFKSQLTVLGASCRSRLFLLRRDNYESMGCFPDNSPSLERWCSILLTRCIHMADCKVLGDFLHILKVEEGIEASFILGRKRKYEIIMLKEIIICSCKNNLLIYPAG